MRESDFGVFTEVEFSSEIFYNFFRLLSLVNFDVLNICSIIKFNFNTAGLSAINNAAGSQIAFGGSFDVNNTTTDQYIFGFTGSGTAGDGKTRLDLVVNNFAAPEPSTFALLSMAPIGIGIVVRRLRRRDS